ncbi:alpha/beta hydrolase [Pleomorphomonas diazotrophica]|uniref:Alpha/beta hydrolase n=1 Tax=Pleomorphomonas diazotrophica TaxID=1166257 RepID=A0A1I4V5X7_9HYPH|nr:alpha/beta fold hydrolase [Pleomorphomonas diazotrophica]PKR87457.1 alpha/beta hydrolase [Pleomorphomonas diazotrophica]SFM96380.1 hypothetical protein SAMN05192571_11086 [Pleomorphomonas diazotrophica]
MTRQVLFVQGGGAGVHDGWDDKLVRSLERELGEEYTVIYPRMPDEASPSYPAWKTALLDELSRLDEGAIVIGHSIGGAVLIHVLAEQYPRQKPGAILLLAAPFLGEGGWQSDEIAPLTHSATGFPADIPVLLYHGSADDEVPAEHLQLYAKALPSATTRVLAQRDHQLNNDLSDIATDIRRDLQPR